MFPRSTVGAGQALTATPFLKVGNTSPQTQSISTLQAWWKVHGVSLLGPQFRTTGLLLWMGGREISCGLREIKI